MSTSLYKGRLRQTSCSDDEHERKGGSERGLGESDIFRRDVEEDVTTHLDRTHIVERVCLRNPPRSREYTLSLCPMMTGKKQNIGQSALGAQMCEMLLLSLCVCATCDRISIGSLDDESSGSLDLHRRAEVLAHGRQGVLCACGHSRSLIRFPGLWRGKSVEFGIQ